ncbi:hypothetical protein HPT27_18635 [Permianibacter sp. IMCC34836]|uniref:hypothetical protein n=1 Tax=Permianibacter fluminis TaxID=2738515 RepID=UPI00155208B6|nr:hypothetical protein [Permianibacter fluminis]NQD39038.1 hypothetical protein [Permianibacter fluminis]
MDLRWLLVIAVVMGIVGFLLGRRTSPGGRALARLQRALENKQLELSRHQEQMSRFVGDMQGELDRVSGAYRDLQATLRSGAEQFAANLTGPNPAIAQASKPLPSKASTPVLAIRSATAESANSSASSPEWSARLAGSWAGSGGPSLASAAACPLPDQSILEAPKDYPAPRRSTGFDEHSYA